MVQIQTIQALFFSPTGTTRKTLAHISEHIGLPVTKPIDLTLPPQRAAWTGEIKGDLLLVGVPVWAGTIPSIMLAPLNKLQGEGKWAIPIAVYGNVGPGSCLEELYGLLQSREFKILAAGQFVGENSFAHEAVPLAMDRPDEADLTVASEFGKQIVEKIESGATEVSLEGKPLEIGESYSRKRDEWPENVVWKLARVSAMDDETCIQCKKCVQACPMGAIDRKTRLVDEKSCFRCFACVRVCSTGSRKIVFPLVESDLSFRIYERFKSLLTTRKEPEIIL